MTIRAEDVRKALLAYPCRYETREGRLVLGEPVSGTPRRLRESGWRNVSHLDEHDFRGMGLEIVEARYVSGARPKRFCRVVVAQEVTR